MHAAQGRLFQACSYSPSIAVLPAERRDLPVQAFLLSHPPYCDSWAASHAHSVRRLTRMVCACNTDGAKKSNATKKSSKALGDSAGVSVSTSRAQASSAYQEHACGEVGSEQQSSTGAPRTSQPPPFPHLLLLSLRRRAGLSNPPCMLGLTLVHVHKNVSEAFSPPGDWVWIVASQHSSPKGPTPLGRKQKERPGFCTSHTHVSEPLSVL